MYSQEIDKILTDDRLSFKAKGIYLIIYLRTIRIYKKEIVRENGKFKKVLYKITK